MLRILISACVAAITTYGCHVWQKRQSLASGGAYPRADKWRWIMLSLELVWTGLMTMLVWAGFMDPVRSLGAYPFYRLGVSLLLGGGFVVLGSLWAVAAVGLTAGGDVRKLPIWRRVNPMGFQMLSIMFTGLVFQHSGWGGPP